jgi:predicted alpha/beta-hydrolase family hydrolase
MISAGRYNRAVSTSGASQTWQIHAGTDETTAVWEPPANGDSAVVFVCAHGAGGHMGDRSILAVTDALRARDIGTVRFDFFYRARRSARPDPMPRLLACFEAVANRVRSGLEPRTVILGGRSMGGRAASVLVSEGARGDGLLLLAYPLHPPGQRQKLRDAHLPAIRIPVLCFNGTRDPFCDPVLMNQVVSRLGGNWRMHWLDGADHGFHVLKSSGRTDRDLLSEVGDTTRNWMDELSSNG